MNKPKVDSQVPKELSQKVLSAIQGALKEEKEPVSRRALKVALWTALCSAILGIPFFLSFRGQLTWIWGVAWGVWSLLLLGGFTLHFYPQPRLAVSGVWSPFIFARLVLVACLATLVQILICPSFVFLSSPLGWNPFFALTNALMRLGGMNLCMAFCGFLFTFVSALLGLGSVSRVLSGSRSKDTAMGLLLVLFCQAPVLIVQTLSEELRPFALAWAFGLLVGCAAAFGTVRFLSFVRPRT